MTFSMQFDKVNDTVKFLQIPGFKMNAWLKQKPGVIILNRVSGIFLFSPFTAG